MGNASNARFGPAIGHSVYDVTEAVTWRKVAKPVLTQVVAKSAPDGRAKMFWEHGVTSMAWNKKLPPRGKLLQDYGRPQNNTAAEVANGRWSNKKTKPVIGRCTVRPEMAWNYDAMTIGSEMRKPFLAVSLDVEVSCNQTRVPLTQRVRKPFDADMRVRKAFEADMRVKEATGEEKQLGRAARTAEGDV